MHAPHVGIMRRPDSYDFYDDYLNRIEIQRQEEDDTLLYLAALGGMLGTGGIGFGVAKGAKEDEKD